MWSTEASPASWWSWFCLYLTCPCCHHSLLRQYDGLAQKNEGQLSWKILWGVHTDWIDELWFLKKDQSVLEGELAGLKACAKSISRKQKVQISRYKPKFNLHVFEFKFVRRWITLHFELLYFKASSLAIMVFGFWNPLSGRRRWLDGLFPLFYNYC